MNSDYKLDDTKGEFWDEAFNPLPNELLFPIKDMYLTWLHSLSNVLVIIPSRVLTVKQ